MKINRIIIIAVAFAAVSVLPGCATVQGWFPGVTPASALRALQAALQQTCGAVPTVKAVETILASQGISNPTEAEITAIASQVCAVLGPPKSMASRDMGASGSPVVLGHYNGATIYGHWEK